MARPVVCRSCGLTRAHGPFSCLICRATTLPATRWEFSRALQLARARMAEAAGVSLEELARQEAAIDDPVSRARKRAELAAPALVRLAQALTLGTAPEELDRVRGGVRVLADLTRAQLAMVGLRAGEQLEVDVSDRMTAFLSRWQQDGGALPEAGPVVLEADPAEPARRMPGEVAPG